MSHGGPDPAGFPSKSNNVTVRFFPCSSLPWIMASASTFKKSASLFLLYVRRIACIVLLLHRRSGVHVELSSVRFRTGQLR